ncbi:hypothetical protein Tco_1186416 [Tanacetum coccineum]
MSTQQDLLAAGFKSQTPMLSKDDYVQWLSKIIHYCKSKPNGKLLAKSILEGLYIYRQVLKPSDENYTPPVPETYRPQNEMNSPKMNKSNCLTANEMWKHIQTFKKGTEIGIQEKSIILLDELEKFTSNEGETVTSFFKRFSVLINDLDLNKLTSKIIHTNLKFLNHLQPEWTHFVTHVKQSIDLYTMDYNKIYDYMKQNLFEASEIRATRIDKFHDPLSLYSKTPATAPPLMANTSQQTYPSPAYTPQQPLPLNNIIVQQPTPNNNNNIVKKQSFLFDIIIDVIAPMQAMQTAFDLMSNAFTRRYSIPTNNNQKISSNIQNKQIAQPMNMNEGRNMQMVVINPRNQGNRRKLTASYLFVTKHNPASSNTNTTLVYDIDGISKVPSFDHYYDNEMYNLFTHEERHPELPESTQGIYVEQPNNSNIHSETLDMDFSRGEVEQHDSNNEETNAYFESLLHNFKFELNKFVMVNRNDKAEIERLTTELA